jgi:2-polyprenyl-6-methoxyphenol hydroxylase-like FAD-dependent oxidoreductase
MRTHSDLTCIAVQWPVQRFDEVRRDVEDAHLLALDEMAPGLAERVRQGRREERFYGTADLPFFYRQPVGPGWALVGDAGYHLDPGTGQGISNAFRDAELLAHAVVHESLAEYEPERNARSRPMYDYTWKVANLAPPSPEEQALIGALLTDQASTNQFFGALSGTVPLQEFFDPLNLGRIVGAQTAALVK